MSETVAPSVVLIAYHFPPDPAVGSLRAAKVARAFRAEGYRVHVVTARRSGERAERPTDDPGLVVHPVLPMPTLDDAYANLKVWMSRRRRPRRADPVERGPWMPPTQLSGWRRLVFSLLSLPDNRQGFILPAWKKARALVRAGARLVYSTAPPFSPHLVGLVLKSSRVRWVMELRDPWADSDQKPWWERTRATDAINTRLEHLCLSRADVVVAVSDGIRRRLASRLSASDSSRLLLVRNGIEHLASATGPARNAGPVRILYAGTFYLDRDPRPFLRGLASVRRKRGMGPEQVRVDFIGSCRSIGPISVEQEIEALGLADVVHIQDWLPRERAKTFVDEADVLLLLAQRQPDQVPNKLYEYLGTRRPVLAFADADGETARMLRQVGGHHVVTGDDDVDVECVLDEVLATAARGDSPKTDDAILQEWTTEIQMKKLLAAVRE